MSFLSNQKKIIFCVVSLKSKENIFFVSFLSNQKKIFFCVVSLKSKENIFLCRFSQIKRKYFFVSFPSNQKPLKTDLVKSDGKLSNDVVLNV